MTATYNSTNNTIIINATGNTLLSVSADINNIDIIEKNINNEYILKANVEIISGGELFLENITLKFNDMYRILNHGDLNINASLITSINTDITKRGFIKSTRTDYMPGYTFNLTNSTISYLGPGGYDIDNVYRCAIYLCAHPCATPGTFGARIPPIINNNIFEYNTVDLVADGRNDIVTNNTFRNSQGNFIVQISNHGTFDNNTLYNNTNGRGYTVLTWADAIITNNTFHDNHFSDGGVHLLIKEGGGGAIIRNNLFYNNTGAGARIGITGSTHNVWSYIENNIINDKYGYGINIVGNGYLGGYDVYAIVRNNTIDGASAFGIRYSAGGYFGSGGAKHVRLNDNIIKNVGWGIVVEGFPHDDSIAINNSITDSKYPYYDVEMGHYSSAGDITPMFINLKYNIALVLVNTGRFLDYKFLDVKVVDVNNIPINNANVTIVNIIDNNYPPINIEGQIKTSFITNSNGHTSLPSDSTNSIAILDFYKTSTIQQEMSYTITATYGSFSNSITITPDITWYRAIPDTYQNTVTIQLPIDISISNITGKITDSDNNPLSNTKIFIRDITNPIQNNPIIVTSTLISGGPVDTNEWKINNTIHTNTTDILTIYPHDLPIGLHDVQYKGTNYCGSTTTLTQQIDNINGYNLLSDINGNYFISSLLPGKYTLTVMKNGYETQSYDYTIVSTETITKDFTLSTSICPTPICEFTLTQL